MKKIKLKLPNRLIAIFIKKNAEYDCSFVWDKPMVPYQTRRINIPVPMSDALLEQFPNRKMKNEN